VPVHPEQEIIHSIFQNNQKTIHKKEKCEEGMKPYDLPSAFLSLSPLAINHK
jgi:hypothetical protein